jgi:streptogramin lyase
MNDLKTSRLVAEIQVGGNPDWQTSLDSALWVTTDNYIARIDQKTNAVSTQIAAVGPCLGLADGFGSVWSPTCGATELVRIDPASNRVVARVPLAGISGHGEGQLVAALGSVWLFTDDQGSLARIDPRINAVADTFATGYPAVALVAAQGSLWATVPEKNAVIQIGADGKVTRTIPVGRGPRFIAAGEGAVWSLGQADGDVTRIDPTTGRVVATIALAVPGEGGCIATGGGAVWVTMPETPVSRIDPATNTVTERFTGVGGDCIGFAAGSVWLSNLRLGTVWRIHP